MATEFLFRRTRVVHCRRERFDKYVGRPSLLGNPYELGDYTREECVSNFYSYARWRMEGDEEFAAAIRACAGLTIGCWCAPKLCHGHAIARLTG